MAKHTEGQWSVKPDGEANFFTIADNKQNWLMRIQHNGEALVQKQEANARLIAASPEMFEVLENLKLWGKRKNGKFSFDSSDEYFMESILSLINKVKGE